MFFVYLNIQFTSFHEHAAPHEHVGLLKHNKLNLPLVLGECQMLFIPDIVQFSFRRLFTLNLTTSEYGILSSFSMNSECQFSHWSTEPIEQSSTHWQLGWLVPKTVQLDLPLLQLLKSMSEKGVWDLITELWHRNDYHCPKNGTQSRRRKMGTPIQKIHWIDWFY